jgi:hypothetical protein
MSSGVLADILYIPAEALPKQKKKIKLVKYPKGRLNILTNTERRLVHLIDNYQLSYSVIAQSIGCTRQYVHQEYQRAIKKLLA